MIQSQKTDAAPAKVHKQRSHSNAKIRNFLIDNDFGLYIEDYFREMLKLEVRRTERSRTPFLLVLIDFEKVIMSLVKKEDIVKFGKMLAEITRETDIKGWYAQPTVIGIIHTEVAKECEDTIMTKIRAGLVRVFGDQIAEAIKLCCFSYPKDLGNTTGSPDCALSEGFPPATKNTVSRAIALAAKRTLDVVGSLFLITLLSPLFIMIPILIKLTSRGPIFFKQTRIGLNGQKFTFLKFRSMHVNNNSLIHQQYVTDYIKGAQIADADTKVYKLVKDPRITPIGKIIRKTSIDELPQFFNVILGNMSLVGPRPGLPYEIEQYDVWHKRRLLEVKPGITGPWQVNGRNKTTFDMMVRMDIQYVMNWTPWLDIKLLVKTPFAVIKGAY